MLDRIKSLGILLLVCLLLGGAPRDQLEVTQGTQDAAPARILANPGGTGGNFDPTGPANGAKT